MAKSKKNKKRKPQLTDAQRYDLLNAAKDALFNVINLKKYSWGYENWVMLHEFMDANQYSKVRCLISEFKNTKNKRYALELLDDIARYSKGN